jgi:L-ribulose-5-phosphate 3-epimerase
MHDFVSRREFLTTTGATLASAALASQVGAASDVAPPGRRLLKAVIFGMVRGNESLTDKFKLLKQVGFDGVELDRHIDAEAVRRAKQESGLAVHGVIGYDHWRLLLSDPDESVRRAGRESFIGAMRDSKAYGGSTALLVPGRVTKTVPYADAYKRSQDEIRKLAPVAEELQITICVEDVWNDMLMTPLEMARYVDEINSPWVGQYFDIGNYVRYGWPEQWIPVMGKRIHKLHIKEFSRKLMNTKGPWAGFNVKIGDAEGDCDWPSVMRALDSIGYHGWATAEVPGGGAKELKDISERMDRIFSSPPVAAG